MNSTLQYLLSLTFEIKEQDCLIKYITYIDPRIFERYTK